MVTKRIVLFITASIMFVLMVNAQAATTIYTNKAAWTAAFSSYGTEGFADSVFNSGVSVVSDAGSVIGGEWSDRVVPGGASTTFSFSPGMFGFGGDWDLANPGGAGTGIAVTLSLVGGGTEAVSAEIPQTIAGGFWGFISDVAFTDVFMIGGTQGGLAETYLMDNMVYSASASPVPVPAAVWLFGSGLLGLIGYGRSKARA